MESLTKWTQLEWHLLLEFMNMNRLNLAGHLLLGCRKKTFAQELRQEDSIPKRQWLNQMIDRDAMKAKA